MQIFARYIFFYSLLSQSNYSHVIITEAYAIYVYLCLLVGVLDGAKIAFSVEVTTISLSA